MKKLMVLCLVGSIAEASVSLKKRSEDNRFGLNKRHVKGELIVKIKRGLTDSFLSALPDYDASLKSSFAGGQNLVLKLKNGDREIEQIARDLSQRDDVEYVEANQIWRALDTVPNDTDFEKQYALFNKGLSGGVKGADIEALNAWKITRGSSNVLVSVIDTGVDYRHKDLRNNYWKNPGETGLDKNGNDRSKNGIDDDSNGFVDDWGGWDFANNDNDPFDDNSHGTHCAGVIGAEGNNALGISGINWDVSLVGIKFLGADGSGTTENAVKSIDYSLTIGAPISSNSWGGGEFSPSMKEVLDRAEKKGQVFLVAAGNDGEDNDSVEAYPANYEHSNLISVAATDNKDKLAYFSNFGAQKVHLAAPGVDIYSTVPGDKYKSLSGTSMATPQVAGVAALIKAIHPDAKADFIKRRLLRGSAPNDSTLGLTVTGGRLSAYNSIESDITAPSVVGGIVIEKVGMSFIKLSWDKSGDDDSEGEAFRYELEFDYRNGLADKRFVSSRSAKPGDRMNVALDGLPSNTLGQVRIRAIDNVGNAGEWSDFQSFQTKQKTNVYDNDGSSIADLKVSGSWGVEVIDGQSVFSDSPGEDYKKNTNHFLQLRPFKVISPDLELSFVTRYDLEKGYDFAVVELSTDEGQSWKEIKSFSGTNNRFESKNLYLYNSLGQAKSAIIRFRLSSDGTVTKDGWYIDQIRLDAAKN